MNRVSRTSDSSRNNLSEGGITIIGLGRWGSSLLASLEHHGIKCHAVAGRRGLQAAGASRPPAWTRARVFWLCVPDAAIQQATGQLMAALGRCGISPAGTLVLHSSGVYSSEILAAAKKQGALTASVHPLMSFPTRAVIPLDDVPFAVEATGRLRTRLFQLLKAMGGRPFSIAAANKVLYHAAAVMASPLLVSLAQAAMDAAGSSGLKPAQARALLQPIMEATLKNFFREGAARSFSGPFARGDATTVSLHLDALAAHPLLEAVYKGLARHALESLPVENLQKLRRLLKTV